MNKLLKQFYLLPISLLFFSPISLSANSLDVKFDGILMNTGCKVTSDSLVKGVKIYNLRKQFINENERSAITPFSIDIEKCSDTDLNKVIKLTWQSSQLVTINNESFLTTQGDSGVVLGLVDNNENTISWNTPIVVDTVSVVDNIQQLKFGVFVRKPASGNVEIGSFTGTVQFKVEYE